LYDYLVVNDLIVEKSIVDALERILHSDRKVCLLRGPAGVSKAQFVTLVSRFLFSPLVFHQCGHGTGEDGLLYKHVRGWRSRSGVRITYGPIPRALQLSRKGKVVLFLSDFDRTPPSADELLLDVLENCRVSLHLDDGETVVQGNHENLVVFMTSSGMREFSEPFMCRTAVITLRPVPPERILNSFGAKLMKLPIVQAFQRLGEAIRAGKKLLEERFFEPYTIKHDDGGAKLCELDWFRGIYRRIYDVLNAEGMLPDPCEITILDPGDVVARDRDIYGVAWRNWNTIWFRRQPPDPPAFAHEMMHLVNAPQKVDVLEEFYVHNLARLAVTLAENNVAPEANIIRLFDVREEDVLRALRKVYHVKFNSIEGYLGFIGVIPWFMRLEEGEDGSVRVVRPRGYDSTFVAVYTVIELATLAEFDKPILDTILEILNLVYRRYLQRRKRSRRGLPQKP